MRYRLVRAGFFTLIQINRRRRYHGAAVRRAGIAPARDTQ